MQDNTLVVSTRTYDLLELSMLA